MNVTVVIILGIAVICFLVGFRCGEKRAYDDAIRQVGDILKKAYIGK